MSHTIIHKWFNTWNQRPCIFCRNKETLEITTNMINGVISEKQIICMGCGQEVNYWAYGYYQYPVTKTEMIAIIWGNKCVPLLKRIKFIIQEALS